MPNKVIRRNLVDQVTESLRESIEKGEYKAGDKLPSENDLASEYGTSRLTVRLAIQKLNALELLDTKVGDGTYVKTFNLEKYIDNVSNIIFSQDMMDDIQEFRGCIEKRFSMLASQNRTDGELKQLNILCGQYEELYENATEVLSTELLSVMAEKDFEIHMKICEMSHNALYRITYQTMHPLLVNYLAEIILTRKRKYDQNKELDKFMISLKTHRLLYKAIKNKDKDAIVDIVDNMINYKVLMKEDYL